MTAELARNLLLKLHEAGVIPGNTQRVIVDLQLNNVPRIIVVQAGQKDQTEVLCDVVLEIANAENKEGKP